MQEHDVIEMETMVRNGLEFDECFRLFPNVSIDEVERVYMRIRKKVSSEGKITK